MVVTFNKNSDLAEIKKLLSARKSQKTIDKPFDAKRFCGTIKFEEDGLSIQRRLRDEWNRF